MDTTQSLTPGLVRVQPQSSGQPPVALTPGLVLNVTVRETPQGDRGVMVGGVFVQAELPANLQDGDSLTVQVLPSTGTVVLRVLSQNPQSSASRGTTVSDLLRALLRQTELPAPSVKDTLATSDLPLSLPLRQLSEGLLHQQTSLGRSVGQVLDNLIQQGSVLTEGRFSDAKTLTQFLERALLPGVERTSALAAEAVQRLANNAPDLQQSQADANLARALLAYLSAPPQDQGSVAAPRLQLLLAATHYAVATGDKNMMSQVMQRNTNRSNMSSLESLLATLTPLCLHNDPSLGQTQQGSIRHLAQNLVRELVAHRDAQSSPQKLQLTLDAAKQNLAEFISKNESTWKDSLQSHEGMEAAKVLARLVKTSETLSTLAPLIRATHEPVLQTIPIALGNTLGNLRLLAQPRRVDADAPEGKTPPHPQALFTKLEFDLILPHLGPLTVHLAHRGTDEILVRLEAPAPDNVALITTQLPELQKTLQDLGYQTINLAARQAVQGTEHPRWLVELGERQAVV